MSRDRGARWRCRRSGRLPAACSASTGRGARSGSRSSALPDGRQVQKRIGPAWTQRGQPAEGTFTKRTAEAYLERVLVAADAGELPMQRRSGVTFAMAAAEWLRYCAHERACEPTTLRDYRHSLSVHLLPAFGDLALEDVSVEMVERWRRELERSPRTKNKLLTVLNGVFRRAKRVYRSS